MFCQNCGNQLAPTSQFCGKCGTPVNRYAPPAPRAVPAAERVIFKMRPSLLCTIFVFLRNLIILFLLIAYATQYTPQHEEDYAAFICLGLCSIAIFIWLVYSMLKTIWHALKTLTTTYTFTTKKLTWTEGIFSRNKRTIPVHKIQDVNIRKHFVLRTFGKGDLVIESAGESLGAILIRCVSKPDKYAEMILKQIEHYS